MCTPAYRCPVCLHSSFSSVTALWQGLMSGASRRLTCPVCQEVLLGLDKLTLHLYSHLPADNNEFSLHTDGKEITNESRVKIIDDNNKSNNGNDFVPKDYDSTASNIYQLDENQFHLNDETKTISNNSDARNTESAEVQGQVSLSLFKNVPYITTVEQSFNRKVSADSFNLEDNSQIQHCQSKASEYDEGTVLSTLQLPLEHIDDDQKFNETTTSPDSEMCAVMSDSTDNVTNEAVMCASHTDTSYSHPQEPENGSAWQDSQVQCRQCGAWFSKNHLLNTHIQLVHTECCTTSEKERNHQDYPFPCHLCSKRFKMRGSLMVHVRFVHGGARLMRGARRIIANSQLESMQRQQQTIASNSPLSQPNNNSPEPFFPSLSELSEQLTNSPTQQPQNWEGATANNQVSDLLNQMHQQQTSQIPEHHETTQTRLSNVNISHEEQPLGQISFIAQWQERPNCDENLQHGMTQESQNWISTSFKKLQPISMYINKTESDTNIDHVTKMEQNTQNREIDSIVTSSSPNEDGAILSSNIPQNELSSSIIGDESSFNEVNDDKLNFQSSYKVCTGGDSNKPYECEVCFKRFTTKYFHKKHQRLHTGERPYKCGTCSKTFAFQQSFHKHLLYHTSAKPHVCTECGQAFKELSTLHNHQRIHTGERPFVCETCGKAFRQRVSYLVHRRIHTGVLPYKCSACNKSFRYKVSQRTHKCPAQPPGNVVRQSELVQRLLMKAVADPEQALSVNLAKPESAQDSPVTTKSQTTDNKETQKVEGINETGRNPHFPPLLTINEESLHQLLSIFPN